MRFTATLKLAVALLLIAFFTQACGTLTGRSTGRFVDDETITAKVKSSLVADKAANLTRVGVKTVNGTVYLNGVVDSETDREKAEEIARGVPQVASVVNDLQVNSPGSASPRN